MRNIPFLIVPFLIYDIFALLIFSDAQRQFDQSSVFTLPTVSGASFSLTVGALLLVGATGAGAAEPSLVKKTYTYKTVDGLKIQADVYRADDEKVRPVLVWVHGGALIMGGSPRRERWLVRNGSGCGRLPDGCGPRGLGGALHLALDFAIRPPPKRQGDQIEDGADRKHLPGIGDEQCEEQHDEDKDRQHQFG